MKENFPQRVYLFTGTTSIAGNGFLLRTKMKALCFLACLLSLSSWAQPSAPAESPPVTFKYAPPDGTIITETMSRKVADEIVGTTNPPLQREERIVSQSIIHRTATGYEIRKSFKEVTGTLNGRPDPEPGGKILLDTALTYVVSEQGELLSILGDKHLSAQLQKLFPDVPQSPEQDVSEESLQKTDKDAWYLNFGKYLGKTIIVGEVWTNEWHTGAGPSNMFMLTKFPLVLRGQGQQQGQNVVEVDCIASTDASHIAQLYPLTLDQKQVNEFFKWSSPILPRNKFLTRTVIDAGTMCLLRKEVVQESIFRSPVGLRRTIENRTSVFTFSNVNGKTK